MIHGCRGCGRSLVGRGAWCPECREAAARVAAQLGTTLRYVLETYLSNGERSA